MQSRTLFFLLVSISFQLDAQNRKVDSLNALMKNADDTSKVNLLNELSRATWYYQLDKAAEYNDIALHLADSVSYKKGFAEANRCRGVILSFRNDSTSMLYLTKALDIFKQLNYKRGIAATLFNQNEFYFRRKQYAKALESLSLSLDIFTGLGDKEAIGAVTNQTGNIYASQAEYPVALQYYMKALAIRQQIGDKPGTAFTLDRIGDMYSKLDKLPEALGYYQQSFKIAQAAGRNQNVIDAAISIGDVYQKQGKYNEALAYFNISLEAEEEFFGKDNVARSFQKIGEVYRIQKKYPLALLNFQKALDIARKKNPNSGADILHSVGQVYFEQGNYSHALEYCRRSLDLARQNKDHETVKNVSLTLSRIYEALKDYQMAYNYHLQYTTAKDTLLNEDLNRRLASLQQSFEVKNRQSQIDLLSRDKQLQQSELNRQKQQRYAFIIGLFLFVVLAIVLIRSNRHKQKANQVLEKTLLHLKSTQAQLIQSEKMASLGELTAGIAHEIQNPLNFVNNFSEVSNELLTEMKNEFKKGNSVDAIAIANDVQQNIEKVIHHGKRADAIVKGMLQHSSKSTGQKELTDINTLADEYIRLAYHGLRAKDKLFSAVIKTDFDHSIEKMYTIPQDIARVLLNLYNNAFYAVNEKKKQDPGAYEPAITVSTKRFRTPSGIEGVEIGVKDNGNGIPQNILGKIFQPFFTTKPAGQGTGLGLSLSYDIVKAHGGVIRVDAKEGAYAEFIIELPFYQP